LSGSRSSKLLLFACQQKYKKHKQQVTKTIFFKLSKGYNKLVFGKHLAKKDIFQTKICWTLFCIQNKCKITNDFCCAGQKSLDGRWQHCYLGGGEQMCK